MLGIIRKNCALLAIVIMAFALNARSGEPTEETKKLYKITDDTPVGYTGGKLGHIAGCPRFKNGKTNTTHGEMRRQGGFLCSKCPGSMISLKRKGLWKEKPVVFDPDTKVYPDPLWMRVHEKNCPLLFLKDEEKAMTLAEADKAGWKIGEGINPRTGKTRKNACCFSGYKRKHPEVELSDDSILYGDNKKNRWKHVAGCHRYRAHGSHMKKTMKEWIDGGFSICGHCKEGYGPSMATISDEEWKKVRVSNYKFEPPVGWKPKPVDPEQIPPKEELDLLVQEELGKSENGIQELPFADPLARLRHFMGMRFFFGWNPTYALYRATGDERLHDKLLESARNYQKLCEDYPSGARRKARNFEGISFMFTMAACSRITLQNAKKYPGKVSQEELAETEAMLEAARVVLTPVFKGDGEVDKDMGIAQDLANQIRNCAPNREMHGVGTLGLMTAALQDLQVVKKTNEYQPTIDLYRKALKAFITTFTKDKGHMYQIDGKDHFYYPYSGTKSIGKDGTVYYRRPEDLGHFGYTVQGLSRLYETVPELGIDHDFMTAAANTLYHNRTVKVRWKGKMMLCGYIQSPPQAIKGGRKGYSGKDRYDTAGGSFWQYPLHAFHDGLIYAMNGAPTKRKVKDSSFDGRIATLYAQYLKALRQDPELIHLGEKK